MPGQTIEKTQQDVIKEQQKKRQKATETNTFLEVIIIILALLLIVAVAIPVGRRLMQQEEASFALKEAKAIVLAARATSYEFSGDDTSMTQNADSSEVSKEALREITDLSACEGKIERLTFDTDAKRVKMLRYVSGDYLVTYVNPGNDQPGGWNVYYVNGIIKDKTESE